MRARGGFQGLLIALCLLITDQVCAALYPQNPLRDDDSVYVSQQGVYRFDGSDPEPVWSSLQGVATFAPVAYRELLLVGSTQGLYALRQADGGFAWHIEEQRTLFLSTVADHAYAVSDQAKLLWAGGQPHAVYALNSADG